VNNTTFPAHGTWYSRYSFIYTDAPSSESVDATVTVLPALPRLTDAA
jgi:hypothetical protein